MSVGGGAWADINDSANATTSVVGPGCCGFPASFNSTRFGWVVGGGYEAILAPKWLLRGEYLHYGFNGLTGTVAPGVTTTPGMCNGFSCSATYTLSRLDINVVRLGLSYRP